jgi:phosphatidylglycerol:prolipoprotein diacylglycerol transferase
LAVEFPRYSPAFDQQAAAGLIAPNAVRSLPVHPTQLYEAVLGLGLGIWAVIGFRKTRFTGEIFCSLILGYAAGRFLIEYLRADTPSLWKGLSLSQLISLCVGLVFGSIQVRGWLSAMRKRGNSRPADLSHDECRCRPGGPVDTGRSPGV